MVIFIIIGKMIDNYLNKTITPIEQIYIVMTGYFFLHLWWFHINTLARKYSDFIDIWQNFLVDQTFVILSSLGESMVLLVKAHHEYYLHIPLLPWLHDTESCEYFFRIAWQINSDFDFAKIIQMLSKIMQYSKVLRSKKLVFEKEKSVW